VSDAEQIKYATIFDSLHPIDGRLSGEQVRPVLLNSRLPSQKLARIWELADIDKDGYLDRVEMYVALHLVYKSLQNEPLPDKVPFSLIHPTKRHLLLAPSRRQSAAVGQATSPVPRYREFGQKLMGCSFRFSFMVFERGCERWKHSSVGLEIYGQDF
jgi:hypothetical protein